MQPCSSPLFAPLPGPLLSLIHLFLWQTKRHFHTTVCARFSLVCHFFFNARCSAVSSASDRILLSMQLVSITKILSSLRARTSQRTMLAMTTASGQLHCASLVTQLSPQYPSHTQQNFPPKLQVQEYTEGLDAVHKAV